MFKLTVPLQPLAADGGGNDLPPIDPRPFKPGGDEPCDTGLDTSRAGCTPAAGTAELTIGADAAPDAGPRDTAIDAMVAGWLNEGWLYLDPRSGEYRNRRWRWRELTDEERAWGQP